MIIRFYTNKDTIDVHTSANITVASLIEQLEEGHLILIETIYQSTFIINCLNINAIEILNPPQNNK